MQCWRTTEVGKWEITGRLCFWLVQEALDVTLHLHLEEEDSWQTDGHFHAFSPDFTWSLARQPPCYSESSAKTAVGHAAFQKVSGKKTHHPVNSSCV